jgi:cytochrome c553
LEAERTNVENGKGPGELLDVGRAIFQKSCAKCRCRRGEGDREGFYPAVAAQHFGYRLREFRRIQNGLR